MCDGQDNDCDGIIDEGVKNACGACDAVPAEVCDGQDNDCDGTTDEGVTMAWYCDKDGDGYAAVGASKMDTCTSPTSGCAHWVAQAPAGASMQDCDDNNPLRFPGAQFGVVGATGNGDLNCDSKVERNLQFAFSTDHGGRYDANRSYRICAKAEGLTSTDCSGMCLSQDPGLLVHGLSIQPDSVAYEASSATISTAGVNPTCSASNSDAYAGDATVPDGTGGCIDDTTPSGGVISIFVRVLCR